MTASQHPYGKQGRHRAPTVSRPHLRRLAVVVGLCGVAALAVVGATIGAQPTVPTVQAAVPVQLVPAGPGHPRPLPPPGQVVVEAVGMVVRPTLGAPTTTKAPTSAPTSSTASSTEATTTAAAAPTTAPTAPPATTTSAPTTTSPPPTTTRHPAPTTTETPVPATTSAATCHTVTK